MSGNEIAIKPHDFQVAKREIQQFSQMSDEELAIPSVAVDGGLFDLFDHKVTGAELNKITSQVQQALIALNTHDIKVTKQFGEVYNAFEALDKDYIQGILFSVKSAEKASQRALKNQEDIQKVVDDIRHVIHVQEKMIAALQQHKNTLSQYAHLQDIDEMWKNIHRLNQRVGSIKGNQLTDDQIMSNEAYQAIEELTQSGQEQLVISTKRLKLIYIMSGGAIIFSIIQLLLNVLGIL